MNKIEALKKHLSEKRCVKVISGINNFDVERVKRVVVAADQSNASAVDIAAREDIIYVTRELTDLSYFMYLPSSLKSFLMAAQNGADVLEIGNYDALYNDGLRITPEEVLDITRKTIDLVGNNIMISVTVPGHIDIVDQIRLAQELEALNIDIIQTEGAAIANAKSAGARGLLEKAHVSIANTIELSRNVSIPVMTASGITANNCTSCNCSRSKRCRSRFMCQQTQLNS
jgi:hypothetical protein